MQFRHRHFRFQDAILEISGISWSSGLETSGNCMRNCEAIAASAAGVEGAGGTVRGLAAVPVGGGSGRATSRRAGPHASDPAPLVWRALEGAEGQAAVPVGGGGAWPGFETTRRAKLAARTARGRIEQPGPTAGPSGARNTNGATSKAENMGGTTRTARNKDTAHSVGPEAPQRLGPHACQLLTG